MLKRGASIVYEFITKARHNLYQNKIIKSNSLKKPVIVVGNITVGGTGKTPFVDYLIKQLSVRSIKSGIISRGYKGKYSGVAKVEPLEAGAVENFGDEPTLLAIKNKETPIYLSRNRAEAGITLLENEKAIDVIISDDGFQHFALNRDLNIVLIDCTEPISNYEVMPKGRLRESMQGINRANYIVFTKSNWVTDKQLSQVKEFIFSKMNNKNIPYAISEYISIYPKKLKKNIVLLSSIAKPSSFSTSVKKNKDLNIIDHIIYADHHVYTEKDVKNIKKRLSSVQLEKLLTTEKDWVKLKEFDELKNMIEVVKIEVKLTYQTKKLNEVIDDLFN